MFAIRRKTILCAALSGLAFLLAPALAAAQDTKPSSNDDGRRLTWRSLKLGATLDEMPDWLAFRAYACGSNGGPPLRKLSGWADFAQCKPDANGLYEVYFEYDNETEYVLRALNDARVSRFVGTTEQGFPVVTSALFSKDGVLRGIRMVTDPRADYGSDEFFDLTDMRERQDFYLLGPFVGGQVGINATTDCVSLPLGEGESKIGPTYMKLDCERVADDAHYILKTRYFRKPGQYGRDPHSGKMTQGLYESSTVFEEYQLGYGPAPQLPTKTP